MDLFVIVAAVLGVGGVVSASVYNLVNSATSNSSVMVIGAAVVGASASTGAPGAISISIKNNGGNPISCTSATCVVTFAGTSDGSTPATLTCTSASGCLTSAPAGWSLTAAVANAPLQFNFGTNTLAPGAQTSFVVNGMTIGGTTTGVAMPTHGASVTLNVVFGTASAQVTVTAQ
jgi:hypothetical protein